MKAIVMTGPGEPDVLELCALPEPEIQAPGDIKVRLHAAGVNPIDAKVRRRGLFFEHAFPAVLGCDGAGEVVAVGSDAGDFTIGERVWFCHGGLGREPGNYAEYTVLPARWAGRMPTSIDYFSAAAAPLALITAWGALFDRGRLQSGQTVLVHGGAGGVGHVAVQLAKLRGAKVITTVGDAEKAERARLYGADVILLHRQEDFVEATLNATAGNGADLVLDCIGPEVFQRSVACTAHFGALVTLLEPVTPDLREARMRNLTIGFELMLTPMLRDLEQRRAHHLEILEQCGRWIDEGRLHVHVSAVFPLAEAAKAHAAIETGHTSGKLVLQIA